MTPRMIATRPPFRRSAWAARRATAPDPGTLVGRRNDNVGRRSERAMTQAWGWWLASPSGATRPGHAILQPEMQAEAARRARYVPRSRLAACATPVAVS